MQHRLPIHKYFITTGCRVSSRRKTLGLIHPSPLAKVPLSCHRSRGFSPFLPLAPCTWCEVLPVPKPGRAPSLWLRCQILTSVPCALSSLSKGRAGLPRGNCPALLRTPRPPCIPSDGVLGGHSAFYCVLQYTGWASAPSWFMETAQGSKGGEGAGAARGCAQMVGLVVAGAALLSDALFLST